MPVPDRPAPRAGRGRPRREETDRRIHDAALRLLREGGPDAVTVEAVAATSGVAKTTVYRRYADREAVLRSGLAAAMRPPSEPAGETPREKIRWALDECWRQASEVLGRGGLAAIVGDSSPRFTDLFREVLAPYADALAGLIRADAAAGEVRADLDPDLLVTIFIGAYLGELVRRGSVDDAFSERCVDLLWRTMTPP